MLHSVMPLSAPTPQQALHQLHQQAHKLAQADAALARHLTQQVLPQLEQLARDIAQARTALVALNRDAHQASQQATQLNHLLQAGRRQNQRIILIPTQFDQFTDHLQAMQRTLSHLSAVADAFRQANKTTQRRYQQGRERAKQALQRWQTLQQHTQRTAWQAYHFARIHFEALRHYPTTQRAEWIAQARQLAAELRQPGETHRLIAQPSAPLGVQLRALRQAISALRADLPPLTESLQTYANQLREIDGLEVIAPDLNNRSVRLRIGRRTLQLE